MNTYQEMREADLARRHAKRQRNRPQQATYTVVNRSGIKVLETASLADARFKSKAVRGMILDSNGQRVR